MHGKRFCIVPAHGRPHEQRHECITNSDREYQEIIRKSDVYSDALDKMKLQNEVRRLIDGHVSEQNALGSRYGMLAYLLGFSDCKAMFLGKCLPTGAEEMVTEV